MEEIINMMYESGCTELNFIYHKTKPTVQKDGNKYDILSIYVEDNTLTIDGVKVAPSYEHKLVQLMVDDSWRKTSIQHIKNIVESEIDR